MDGDKATELYGILQGSIGVFGARVRAARIGGSQRPARDQVPPQFFSALPEGRPVGLGPLICVLRALDTCGEAAFYENAVRYEFPLLLCRVLPLTVSRIRTASLVALSTPTIVVGVPGRELREALAAVARLANLPSASYGLDGSLYG